MSHTYDSELGKVVGVGEVEKRGLTTYLHDTPSTRYQYLIFKNATVS